MIDPDVKAFVLEEIRDSANRSGQNLDALHRRIEETEAALDGLVRLTPSRAESFSDYANQPEFKKVAFHLGCGPAVTLEEYLASPKRTKVLHDAHKRANSRDDLTRSINEQGFNRIKGLSIYSNEVDSFDLIRSLRFTVDHMPERTLEESPSVLASDYADPHAFQGNIIQIRLDIPVRPGVEILLDTPRATSKHLLLTAVILLGKV